MGSALSRTLLKRRPSTANAPPYSGDLVVAEEKEEEHSGKVDYTNLPCPVRYQDLNFEASRILKPTDFQGLHFVLMNQLNENSQLHTSSSWSPWRLHAYLIILKSPYEFGPFYNDSKLLITGKINTHGMVKLTNGPHCLNGVFLFDYEGKDYRSQFQFGNKGLCGVNCSKSVNPNLSLGIQLLWLGDQTKSVFYYDARYSANKMIASGRISSDGSISLSYVQNFSEKVSLASEFMYSHSTRDFTSSFGYEYKFGECLLRGKVDCNAVISSYFERKICSGTRLLLFAQIDHVKKNHKFGYGLEIVRGKPTIVQLRTLLH